MKRSIISTIAVYFGAVMLPTLAVGQNPAQDTTKPADPTTTLPLKPTRKLKFTTNEGTWISVDLSPDQKTVVFDLIGDLYTVPITGGQATRITSGQGFDMQPRWSPDGKKIVFVSDRSGSPAIWLVNADGTKPKLFTAGSSESPIFSRDGKYIIANGLKMYHVDGGSGFPLGGGSAPALAADDRYLWVNGGSGFADDGRAPNPYPYFGTDSVDHPHPRSSTRRPAGTQVGQLDLKTGKVIIRTDEFGGAYRPVASPDGRWLVYATRFDARPALRAKDLKTGEEHWLVMDVQRDDHEAAGARDVYPGSAFTADSKHLITSFGGKIWKVEVPSGKKTEIPFTAEIDQDIGPLVKFDYPINDSILSVTQVRGARPSPDGRRLVFAALDRLYLAELPAGRGNPGGTDAPPSVLSKAVRLTKDNVVEHAPVWSPDGKYVAYVTWSDVEGGAVYRVKADGSGSPERLTRQPGFYDKLMYSADGKRLVVVRGSKMSRMRMLEDFGSHNSYSEMEIVWLPADGSDTAKTVTNLGYVGTKQGRNVPHIGPDPERIYLFEGGVLVSMRYDGTDRKEVVRVSSADEVLISPKGSHALVQSNHQVYVIMVPPVGGKVPTVPVGPGSIMPARKLTKVGGDFIGWRNDGNGVVYSIGRTVFWYDLPMADSLARDSVAKAEQPAAPPAPDTAKADSTKKPADAPKKPTPAYEPQRYDIDITVPKDRPKGSIVLSGAKVITMKGDEIIESADIVVTNNRIVAIGPKGTIAIPLGAKVIDVTGKTILPGYVDIHAHTWVAWGVHRSQVSQFLAQFAYGITTQRDPQTSTEDVLSYGDLMEIGELIGPRLYSTGPGVFSSDAIGSLDDARDVLRRYSEHYRTQTIKQYMVGNRRTRQLVIQAAKELGLTPTAEGGLDFVMNLTLMQDGYAGLEHSLPIWPLFRDVSQLAAQSGLTYTPTLVVSYGGPQGIDYYFSTVDIDNDPKLRRFTPHDEIDKWARGQYNRFDQYVFPGIAAGLARIVEAGGRVGLGSHGEVQGLGAHWELWMMASGGMRNHDALRSATFFSADAIGLGKDIGTLEVGKLADLQVLDKDPLVDLKNSLAIRYVMKNGRLYDASTLDEVWPTPRKLPEMWWWKVEPPAGK